MRTCIWITGLPGVGKTTIANQIQAFMPDVQILDGDDVRKTFWPQLGNVHVDRVKNVLRICAIAEMLMEHGATVIVACVSPDLKPRKIIRERLEKVGTFKSVLP